ncbi:MAG: TrbI/VirB10 family protein [Maricaulaceae bacterium]
MSEGTETTAEVGAGNVNAALKDKQFKYGAVIVIGFVVIVYLLVSLSSDNKPKSNNIARDDLTTTVQRKPGDKDSFAVISKQVNTIMADMDKYKKTNERMNEFLDAQGGESILEDIRATVNGNASTLDGLAERVASLEQTRLGSGSRNTFGPGSSDALRPSVPRAGSGAIPARPSNADSIFAPKGRVNSSGQPTTPAAPTLAPTTRRQNVIELFKPSETGALADDKEAQLLGAQMKADRPEVFDTEHYVPPNAYVSARLVVSVDAPIGEAQEADPKAAQFIITGPAKHVQSGGKIEQTELEGCLVNGSAQGNLSSERVFIKLHAMTCPLGDGRVSVSKVEGYATHLGKNGIRGTVVSREGDLVTKAMIAGTVEGLGRTASQFGQGNGLATTNGGVFGQRPSSEDIAVGSIGSGIASGAGEFSKYLMDRARAYEPVVSLPTGIEVELVFISGTLVRPIEDQQ